MASLIKSDKSDLIQSLKHKISLLENYHENFLEDLKNLKDVLSENPGESSDQNKYEIRKAQNTLLTFINNLEYQKNDIKNNLIDILETSENLIEENKVLETKYEILFEKSNDAILTVDRNGKYLSMNTFASQSIKLSVNDFVGKTLWELQEKGIADLKHDLIKKCIDENIFINTDLDFRGLSRQYSFQPLGDHKTCMFIVHSSQERIENHLFKIEKFLNDSQRITNLGSWEWNLKTNENIWSDHLYEIYGLSRAVVPSNESFIEIVHPDDIDKLKKLSEESFTLKVPQIFQFRIIRPDGQLRFIEAREEAFFSDEGEAIKVFGTNQDITDRLIIERKLEEQQKLLISAEKISGIGSWSWNIPENIVTWSKNLYSIYALEPENGFETIEFFLEMIHPDDQLISRKIIENVFLKKKSDSWEFRIVNKNNIVKYMVGYVDIEMNESGEVQMVYGTIQDITERKITEEKLVNSEISLKASQRIARLGSWEYDLRTGGLSGSDEVFEIFGMTEDNKEGEIKDFFNFIHPEDRDAVSIAINDALEKNIPYNIDHRIIRPSGEIKHVNEQAEIIRNDNNEPIIMRGTVLDITERKIAEISVNELLRESQALNEELVVSEEQVRESLDKSLQLNEELVLRKTELDEAQKIAKLGRWEFDLHSNQISWSEEIFSLMALDPLLGAPDFETYINMVYPDDRSIFTEAVSNAINYGLEYNIEIRMIRADGLLIWTLGKGKAVRNEENEIIKLVGINADISDKKFAEVSLTESEQLFRAVVQNSSDFVQLIDVKGNVIYVSPSIERILGYSDSEFVEMDISKILHPYDLVKSLERFNEIIQNPGQSKTIELRMKHKFGNWVWIESLGTNLLLDPAINAVVANNRSITERKLIEEELVGSEKKYRMLMESASDGIYITDRAGNFTVVNTTACDMMGYTKEELLSMKISDLILPDELSEIPVFFEELYKGKVLLSLRQFVRKDGSVFSGEVSAKQLEYNVLQAFIRDISERKRAEEQLQSQNQELIKINAELDKFVYRASHDLRAPLASVLGLINIAKIENDITVKENYYGLMEKSINKLDGFIQSIINFSRNSRVETKCEKINFEEMITDTLDDLKYMQSTHKVVIKTSISGVDFYSDAFRLKLIFNNIISNAFRYSVPQREQPFLKIDIITNDQQTILKFSDNGQGIQNDSLVKIFEMFYRATQSNAGSGLGLYIVKDVIDALKGEIEVQSVYGEGTVFLIYLPNLKAQPGADYL